MLKEPLGPWHLRVQHRGYEGSFAEATIPGMQRRLIDLVSTQVGDNPSQAIMRVGVLIQRKRRTQETQCASGILRRDLERPEEDYGDASPMG